MFHKSYIKSTRFTSLGSLGRFVKDVVSSKSLDFTASLLKNNSVVFRGQPTHPVFKELMNLFTFQLLKTLAIHPTTLKGGSFLANRKVNINKLQSNSH